METLSEILLQRQKCDVTRFLIALRTHFHLHTNILNISNNAEGEKLQVCLNSLNKGSQKDSL